MCGRVTWRILEREDEKMSEGGGGEGVAGPEKGRTLLSRLPLHLPALQSLQRGFAERSELLSLVYGYCVKSVCPAKPSKTASKAQEPTENAHKDFLSAQLQHPSSTVLSSLTSP